MIPLYIYIYIYIYIYTYIYIYDPKKEKINNWILDPSIFKE